MIHPNPPDKIAGLLKIARDSGLTVKRDGNYATCVTWSIISPNPVDDTQVRIAWNPGPNGGRVTRTVYYGPGSIMRKATRNWVRIVLVEMGDSLQRHQQREAAKAAIESAVVTPEQVRADLAPDPTRPGWFQVGQIIMNRTTGDNYAVLAIESNGEVVTSVWVSINGGYGNPRWFGDHPDAGAPLAALEGPHIGRPENTMRAWPKSVYAAIEAVRHTLTDQCLPGYVLANPSGPGVVVNLPRDTRPDRHLVLLSRYIPYPVHVGVHTVSPASDARYYTLLITPKG